MLIPKRTHRHEHNAASSGLDQPLIRLDGNGNVIRLSEVCGSISCIADTGAGKTSGVLCPLVVAGHRHGFSFVHVCVKRTDADLWRRLAERCGRNDIRSLSVGHFSFNPLGWAQDDTRAGGGLAENLVKMICLPARRRAKNGATDLFWLDEGEVFARAITIIFRLAGVRMSYALVNRTLLTLAQDVDEVHDPAWQARCPAFAALLQASGRALTPAQRADLEWAADMLLRVIPNMPHRTRASVVSTITSAVDPLVHGEIGLALNGDHDTWSPKRAIEQPSVEVFDIPLQVYGAVGATLQRILINAVQEEVLRRDVRADSHIVMIVADEYQEFLDEEADLRFLRTARSQRGCMFLATQCVGNIRSAVTTGRDTRATADALMGLPVVKIFGASTDVDTIEMASRTFSSVLKPKVTFGSSESDGGGKRGLHSGGGRNTSVSRELARDVPEGEFLKLRRGGPDNSYCVDVFISVSGRIWSTRRPSLLVTFRQVLL